ncbi:MAG TPA: zinc-dependent metalloprotease [Chitinophagaceae bacterium]|nr:zinc-dependent metalloprotease [Chitinophagaceae bacterium]
MRIPTFKFRELLLLALLVTALPALAQEKKPVPPATPNGNSTNPAVPSFPGMSKTGPKPYKDVITDKAMSKKGLFTVHKVEDKWYFEIADSLLGRDLLVVNRLSKAAAGMRNLFFGYAGDQIGNNVISFEKGPNNRIFLKKISFDEFSKDSVQPMYRAVMNSNIQPIVAAFDIAAFSKDSTGSVIDMTSYINTDNDVLNFAANLKNLFQVGGQQTDKSYIVNVKAYPLNIEIKTVKTYSKSSGGGFGVPNPLPFASTGGGQLLTMELNSSLLLLPKTTMQQRFADPRVGFFTRSYTDFDINPQGVKEVDLVVRWKLEPKDEDIEKYKRGELVEPKKPIIYYIDPATPRKWVPYLIQGVNDWQAAFEKAGFKNAIMAKLPPTPQEDSTWSLEDARFSAIVYKPSDIPNASGPNVHDPRSGEILESHINWYHNVMNLLRNWYFIQCAATDPRARKIQFDDELMGQLIRFVSSHEVGHTLGLRHNFGSSSTVPVEKLRDKAWVEANGHTPSIMDYARFNYVAQPEDNISPAGLYPRIGDYDKWAIEWGYRKMYDATTPEAELPLLNKITTERLQGNKRLFFGTEQDPDDPHNQNEDLGDNAMKAGTYGIKNLQRIVPNLMEWTKVPNEDYSNLAEIYNEIVTQFNRYMGHALKNIGGIYNTPKVVEQAGPVYEYTPKATQQEAMAFLAKNILTTPTWLINREISSKTGSDPVSVIGSRMEGVLNSLLNNGRLNKLISAEAALGNNAYTITELMSDLQKNVWTELYTHKPIDVYRRNLQKAFVERFGSIISPAAPATGSFGGITITFSSTDIKKTDIISVAKGTLRGLRADINAALPGVTDKMTRYHLQDMQERIARILDPK